MTLGLALAAWSTVATAPTQSPCDVAVLDDAAAAAFGRGEYSMAAARWQQAYLCEPRPEYLFGQGTSEQLAGACRDAIPTLELFIARSDVEEDLRAARALIAQCRATLAVGSAPPVHAEPHVSAPAKVAAAPSPVVVDEVTSVPRDDNIASQRRAPRAGGPHWIADPAGASLTGVGLVVGVAAAALYGAAFRRADQPSLNQDEYVQMRRSVDRLQVASAVLASSAAALLLAGTLRYALHARKSRRTARRRASPMRWGYGRSEGGR